MSRRLTLAIVGVVAGALLLAGLGTLLVVDRANGAAVRRSLVSQARALLAELGPPTSISQPPRTVDPGVLALLKHFATLEDDGLVFLGPGIGTGTFIIRDNRGRIPLSALSSGQMQRLYNGKSTTGSYQGLVYLVVPGAQGYGFLPQLPAVPLRPAVLVAAQEPGPAAGLGYLLVISGTTLALAALVAVRLSRRITQPLTAAVVATRRIASGDLETRVPPAPHTYPELASLTGSIDAMAASLARSQTLERQFLLSVSHDLRTPLTSIRGFAEAIADGAATDPSRAAEVIGSEARRLERLVKDLLELARLESRGFSLDLRPVDLSEVIADTVEGFRPALDEAGVGLEITQPDAGLWSLADPDRVAQVLANLLENASKFARAQVSVQAFAERASVVIVVTDDGEGISEGDLPHVFERLYTADRRSDRRSARYAGSGLGLAIVAELVTAMGGEVEARSPIGPGGGTALVITLATTTATGPRTVRQPAGSTSGRLNSRELHPLPTEAP